LTDENLLGSAYFVLDLDSGLLQVLAPDLSDARVDAQGGSAGIFPGWRDSRTLVVRNITGERYLLDLDGSTSSVREPTPLPRGETVLFSQDGEWAVYGSEGGARGVSIRTGADLNRMKYRITSAISPVWSPAAPSTLALLTNVCAGPDINGGFDLALFDAVTGELRVLSDDPHQLIPAFEWRPDGRSIAFDLVFSGNAESEPRAEIVLVDTVDSSVRTLAAISAGGELVPVGWSPDGEKLLFGYNGGRGLCDPDGTVDAPTTVEVVAE
jgi:hypothetical protein